MLKITYLHHGNQGPDVGKFKLEFPSNFQNVFSRTNCKRLDVCNMKILLCPIPCDIMR